MANGLNVALLLVVPLWMIVGLGWLGAELLAIRRAGRWEAFRARRLEAHTSWLLMLWFVGLGGLAISLAMVALGLLQHDASTALVGVGCIGVGLRFAWRMRTLSRIPPARDD